MKHPCIANTNTHEQNSNRGCSPALAGQAIRPLKIYFVRMKKQISYLVIIALAVSISGCKTFPKSGHWELASPDGHTLFSLTLENGMLSYKVSISDTTGEYAVIEDSPLGLVRNDQSFATGLTFEKASEAEHIDETYALMSGKNSHCRNNANQIEFTFRGEKKGKIQLIARAYDDGVAFRYRFPEKSDKVYTIIDEQTGFKIPERSTAWIAPYDTIADWSPAYETNYMCGIPSGTPSPQTVGWAFPALFHTGRFWVLLTEAGLDTTFYGAHLRQNCENGLYRIMLPLQGEANGMWSNTASSVLPWETPWRVIVTGTTPAPIIETNLITSLSEPCRITDLSWIRPGRASWSWWSDHDSPQDFNRLVPFIDLASEMGWEYSLIDANWNNMKNGTIQKLLEYAAEKKVGLTLWYNSGGPHNRITEQPRDIMNDPEKRREEMKKLQEWGVKGIKVDFFQSDKQDMIKLYYGILKDAADHQLLVDFHGCTLPRGWSRTWPNLLTMEGVRGAEQYSWDPYFGENAHRLNVVYVFTRNAIGPMDYTPVTFSNYNEKIPHTTTWAHELALAVAFESGIQHYADRVNAFRSLPQFAKEFLKIVPASWDETRYIAGTPDSYVIIARRKGATWYLAGLNALKEAQNVSFTLPFVSNERARILLYIDGNRANQMEAKEVYIAGQQPVTVRMLAKGGFSGQIVAADK